MCTTFLIDSDGVHKCDHTRGVDTKQLDDGTDHTFVSAGGREYVVVDPTLQNRYQSTIDTHLGGGSSSSGR
jgi:hypothetical protein